MDTAALQEIFRLDHFAAHVGIEVLAGGDGRARTKLVVQPHHLNGLGTVQGGALFTLADLAFAVAVNSRGVKATGLNASINWLKPARAGTLVAEATEVSCARRIATYLVRITDDEGSLVATFHGTGYRLDERWPDGGHTEAGASCRAGHGQVG
jgi:acyl-CoA thioesterase